MAELPSPAPAPAGGADVAALAGRIFAEVLERQAFLFADPASMEDLEAPPEDCVTVRMAFSGHAEGRLAVSLPRSLAVEVAANVLGTDADDPLADEKALDACKELLNVTCGNLLTAVWGDGPVFDLSIPECAPVAGEAFREAAAASAAGLFLVEDRPLLLRVDLAAGGRGPW